MPATFTLRRPLYLEGVWSWVTTVDHKRIGILYGVTALLFFIRAGIDALFMRLQLARPDQEVVDALTYNQLFTVHGTTMIFFAAVPLAAALFNYLVPLMIGARDVAFPRLNALSYWLFLFSGLLFNLGVLDRGEGGVPDAGWTAYTPLSTAAYSPGLGMDFYVLSLLVLGIGTMLTAFNIIITILNLRAPGMTFYRMPVFVWNALVVSFLIIFAIPPLTIALTLLMFDRFFATTFFNTAMAADPLVWQHFFWIFGHPEVYIIALPAFGIYSDVLPTFARKPLFGYPLVVLATILIFFYSLGVWAHHMFVVGLGAWANSAFAITTMVIAVPTGIKIFNWLATLWGGSIQFKTPLLFTVGGIAIFVLGGLSGVMHAVVPVDTQQHDTYFVIAHFHYVIFGSIVFGLVSGTYYWFPKMFGKMLNERLGIWQFWLVFGGFNLTFMPMHILGALGMPRRVFTYSADQGWTELNFITTIGSFIIAISFLVMVINLVRSARLGPAAGPNPWQAPTLEWATSSPPPHFNFRQVPEVHSRYPLWDIDEDAIRQRDVSEPLEEPEMPSPSVWPVVVAAGVTLLAGGFIVWKGVSEPLGLAVIVLGGLIALIAIYAWAFEPAIAPSDRRAGPVHH